MGLHARTQALLESLVAVEHLPAPNLDVVVHGILLMISILCHFGSMGS